MLNVILGFYECMQVRFVTLTGAAHEIATAITFVLNM